MSRTAAAAVLHMFLIRLARRISLHDQIKGHTGAPAVGDLVVETSRFKPDPDSIGFLRGIETDGRETYFLIEPLNAPAGTPWDRWGQRRFQGPAAHVLERSFAHCRSVHSGR